MALLPKAIYENYSAAGFDSHQLTHLAATTAAGRDRSDSNVRLRVDVGIIFCAAISAVAVAV